MNGPKALALGAALLGWMALSACGGAAEPTAAPTTAPTATTTAPVAAAPTAVSGAPAPTPTPAKEKPQYGGTYSISTSNPRIGQDPHKTTGSSYYGNFGRGMSQILRTRHGEEYGRDVVIVGDLAERWELTDPTTWVFYLNKGIKWHNIPPVNGREFTADDVVYNVKRLADSAQSVQAGYWINLQSVEALDRYTVRITLKKPQANFANLAALGYHKMVAREAVEAAGGDLRDGPHIGTGPWLVDCEVDIGCTAKRFPDYFRKDEDGNQLPYLEKLRLIVFADTGVRFVAFRAQQLDIHGTTDEEQRIAQKAHPEVLYTTGYSGGGYIFFMRQDKAPWSDERVRMALSIGFSRDEVEQATRGTKPGEILYGNALGPVSSDSMPSQEEFRAAFKRDVPRAKQLLADAGYPNGFDGEFLVAKYDDINVPTAEIMIAQLAEVGIRLKMALTDPPGYLSRCYTKKPGYNDVCGMQLGTPAEIGLGLLDFYHSTGGRNSGGIKDPSLDKMIEDQATEIDLEKRRQLLLEIQRYLLKKNYLLNQSNPPARTALWPWVRNYSLVNDYPAYGQVDVIWYDQALYKEYHR